MKKKNLNINVLVVDDSPETIELIKRNLESVGYQVYAASNVQSAIKVLESVEVNLVITDLKMPGENGIALVRHVSENFRGIGVLVITGFPSIEGAIESIKIGGDTAALLEKEKALGPKIKFEDILPEVAGVYPRIMKKGEMDAGAWSCGMVAGLIRDVPTVKELIDRIMREAEEIIASRLTRMAKAA